MKDVWIFNKDSKKQLFFSIYILQAIHISFLDDQLFQSLILIQDIEIDVFLSTRISF